MVGYVGSCRGGYQRKEMKGKMRQVDQLKTCGLVCAGWFGIPNRLSSSGKKATRCVEKLEISTSAPSVGEILQADTMWRGIRLKNRLISYFLTNKAQNFLV